ncbi:MAG: hypothetical protein HFG93_08490, partial [Dorea sp.]|nr:hypothetical protein [Dorea sp.]
LSWIERLATDQKVGGSNPLAHVEVLADFLQGLFGNMPVSGISVKLYNGRMSDGGKLGYGEESDHV